MPALKFLIDTNVICDWMRGAAPVAEWLEEHRDQVAISTFSLAEIRRGNELKAPSKAGRDWNDSSVG